MCGFGNVEVLLKEMGALTESKEKGGRLETHPFMVTPKIPCMKEEEVANREKKIPWCR